MVFGCLLAPPMGMASATSIRSITADLSGGAESFVGSSLLPILDRDLDGFNNTVASGWSLGVAATAKRNPSRAMWL